MRLRSPCSHNLILAVGGRVELPSPCGASRFERGGPAHAQSYQTSKLAEEVGYDPTCPVVQPKRRISSPVSYQLLNSSNFGGDYPIRTDGTFRYGRLATCWVNPSPPSLRKTLPNNRTAASSCGRLSFSICTEETSLWSYIRSVPAPALITLLERDDNEDDMVWIRIMFIYYCVLPKIR